MLGLVVLLATLHLTAKDNNRLFTVRPQTPIVVALVANPSTGYRWIWETVLDAPHPLGLVSQRYVAPKNDLPGAPGKEVFRFVARRKGFEVLQLAYERTWRPRKVARRVDFKISVR